MSMDNGLWEMRRVEEDESYDLQVGPLHIRIARWQDELHYTSDRETPPVKMKSPTAERQSMTTEWNRWICGKGKVACQVKPLLPPRAVVVRPFMPLQVIPGERVELFVSIPVWVGVCLTTGDLGSVVELFEEPTVVLSNSWFGLPVEGELCYALKTRARRRLEDLRPDAHLVVCPITLINAASKPLVFERLCIRLQHVSLYAGATHLWTNRATLDYRGEDAVSGLRFEEMAPSGDGAMRLLSGPRKKVNRGGAQKALDSIRNFSAFWG